MQVMRSRCVCVCARARDGVVHKCEFTYRDVMADDLAAHGGNC